MQKGQEKYALKIMESGYHVINNFDYNNEQNY